MTSHSPSRRWSVRNAFERNYWLVNWAVIAAVLLVTAPADLVLSGGNMERYCELVPWRVVGFLWCMPPLVALRFVHTGADRYPRWAHLAWLVLGSGVASVFIGRLEPVGTGWMFGLTFLPAATAAVLVPAAQRLVLNLSVAGAVGVGILVGRPSMLFEPAFHLLLAFLATWVVTFMVAGVALRSIMLNLFERSLAQRGHIVHLSELVEARTREATHAALELDVAHESLRDELARELHDELGHLLVSHGLALESLAAEVDDSPLCQPHLDNLNDQLAAIRQAVRAVVRQLRRQGGGVPLVASILETQAEILRREDGVEVEVVVEPDDARLTPEQSFLVTRIVQESLTNIRKHAQASRVALSGLLTDGQVVVSVWDDGRGFDVDQDAAGFGLVGMRERVLSVGGNIDIASAPGKGTEVTLTLPDEI